MRSLQILYIFLSLAEKVTIFASKIVTARNINIYKSCKLYRAIFSVFCNVSQPNIAVFLILTCPIKLLRKNLFFLPRYQILVYYANCPFVLKSNLITTDFKRNESGRTQIYEYDPPPPIIVMTQRLS